MPPPSLPVPPRAHFPPRGASLGAMAVLLETSKGDMVIDLHVDEAPKSAKNFLKLCKCKYYNNVLFHAVSKDFVVQTGDPTGTGKGGSSIYGQLYGEQARFFEDEIRASLKHKAKGTVSMALSLIHI